MKSKLLLLLALVNLTVAYGQTNVSGGIFSNTTWTKANSPYIVTGDIAVYPNDTLFIEPGVVVKVNDGLKIVIRGVLIAVGTINDTIQFISNSSAPGISKWIGFQIENDLGGKVKVNYFKGGHAEYLFKTTSNSYGDVLSISNSYIFDNKYAIWGTDFSDFSINLSNSIFLNHEERVFTFCQNSHIENCKFKKGKEGIHSGGDYNITVNNCEFTEFTESTTRTAGTYTNCKFYNNTNGLKLFPKQHLINCEIFNNTYGIVLYYSLQPTNFSFSNTCLYNNTVYDIQHLYSYNIDLTGVSWKESDSIAITNKIYDAHDNINLGIVKFSASNQCGLSTYTSEIKNSYDIKVYPNPFSVQTTLQSNVFLNNATLTLYNSLGQSVKQIRNISGHTITLHRDNIPNGIYNLLLIENNKTFSIAKIVITDN